METSCSEALPLDQSHYFPGTCGVDLGGAGASVTWRVQYLSDGQPTLIIRTIVATLQKVGLESIKKRFG